MSWRGARSKRQQAVNDDDGDLGSRGGGGGLAHSGKARAGGSKISWPMVCSSGRDN